MQASITTSNFNGQCTLRVNITLHFTFRDDQEGLPLEMSYILEIWIFTLCRILSKHSSLKMRRELVLQGNKVSKSRVVLRIIYVYPHFVACRLGSSELDDTPSASSREMFNDA